MKREKKYYDCVCWSLIMACVFASCQRQTLECEYIETVRIPVHIDWTKADLQPQNVTMLFYDQYSGNLVKEHCFANNDKRVQTVVDLVSGKYTVVVFNELRDQIDFVRIGGYKNLHTLRAYPVVRSRTGDSVEKSLSLYEPTVMACAVVRELDITDESLTKETYLPMGKRHKANDRELSLHTELMNIVPERKVGTCQVAIHFANLMNARLPVLAKLKNLSTGYHFESDENEMQCGFFEFMMRQVVMDKGSLTNGLLKADFATFGLVGDRFSLRDQPIDSPLTIDLKVMLANEEKTIWSEALNVNESLKVIPQKNGAFILDIVVKFLNTLPVIDKGESTDSAKSGFQVDLVDWSVVEVPILAP